MCREVEKRDEQRQGREGRVVKCNESIDMCLTAIVACNYSHVHLALFLSHSLFLSLTDGVISLYFVPVNASSELSLIDTNIKERL